MQEKENQAVEVSEAAAPATVKSFRCSAPKGDWHTFVIAFLTSAIAIAVYHVGLLAYDMLVSGEPEPAYCVCHQNAAGQEEEEQPRKFEGKRKMSPEQREKFRARMERLKNLPPEVKEKVKNMSKEERREFFKKMGENAPEKKAPAEKAPGSAE